MEKRKRWRDQRLNTQNQDYGVEIVEDYVDLKNVNVLTKIIKDTWMENACPASRNIVNGGEGSGRVWEDKKKLQKHFGTARKIFDIQKTLQKITSCEEEEEKKPLRRVQDGKKKPYRA